MEAAKLQPIVKDDMRREQAIQKVRVEFGLSLRGFRSCYGRFQNKNMNDSFREEAEKSLNEKMDKYEQNQQQQINFQKEKLQQHVSIEEAVEVVQER